MEAEQTSPDRRKKTPPSWFKREVGRVFKSAPRVGLPSQLEAAGALGVCLVFSISLLPFSRLDRPLTIALFAFVIAMPLLVGVYLTASKKDDLSEQVALAASATEALLRMIGQLAVGIGVLGVIWHLSDTAGWVLLIAFAAVPVIQGALSAILLLSEQPNEPPPDYEI